MPKPMDLRNAIADSIAEQLKSYDVASFCEMLGLAAQAPDEDPFNSKRLYVKRRLQRLDLPRLQQVAKQILSEWDDEILQSLASPTGFRTQDGEPRNLIFAADGPKPQIVLRDAINNIVEIVKNSEHCLLFDDSFHDGWLRWTDLIEWWRRILNTELEAVDIARHLWLRLSKSMASDPERLVFNTYCKRYGHADGFTLPALIPQVYLHYNPYAAKAGNGALIRQRMDFLLLMPDGARVVIEVDGKQHYAHDNGIVDPARYSTMVSEDRQLRLSGYDVYRFGGHELMQGRESQAMMTEFFDELLERHLA